jgi:hypothetical protein
MYELIFKNPRRQRAIIIGKLSISKQFLVQLILLMPFYFIYLYFFNASRVNFLFVFELTAASGFLKIIYFKIIIQKYSKLLVKMISLYLIY